MVDCSDLGNCLIPMWVQYLGLVLVFLGFSYHCYLIAHKDPYER